MTVFADQVEVDTQLGRMGLTISALQRVVMAGAGGFASTTTFHPSAAPGTSMYFEATAALRRVVTAIGEDWTFDEADHQPRTFSDARGVSIVVQSGDENTGIAEPVRQPRTRNIKGSATGRKVVQNLGQLALFTLPSSHDVEEGVLYTWLLLIAIADGVVRAELSLPRAVDEQGRPYAWEHRIILPEQEIGAATEPGADLRAADVEVDVKWKQ